MTMRHGTVALGAGSIAVSRVWIAVTPPRGCARRNLTPSPLSASGEGEEQRAEGATAVGMRAPQASRAASNATHACALPGPKRDDNSSRLLTATRSAILPSRTSIRDVAHPGVTSDVPSALFAAGSSHLQEASLTHGLLRQWAYALKLPA